MWISLRTISSWRLSLLHGLSLQESSTISCAPQFLVSMVKILQSFLHASDSNHCDTLPELSLYYYEGLLSKEKNFVREQF